MVSRGKGDFSSLGTVTLSIVPSLVTSILKNICHLQMWETNLTHLRVFLLRSFGFFFRSNYTECLHFQGILLFSVKLLASCLGY